MLRDFLRRILSLGLSAVLLLALLPAISAPALAAVSGTLTGLSNEDIIATYTGTDDGANSSWAVTGGNSISGSVVGTAGMCSDSHYNTTLTITNNKPTAAILSFDYAIAQNSGTIQVAGTNVTANGSYSANIGAGTSINIYIASGSTDNETTIDITNLTLIADVQATTTFQPAENGSYTVDGAEITEETVKIQQSTVAYSLSATADSGYKFVGWYSVTNGAYLSTEATASLYFDSDQTVTAKFVEEDLPVFDVGGAKFTGLNEANSYASSNDIEKITLVSDGILTSGDYTISEGVILLIPFDEAGTCYTTAPATTGNVWTDPSVYRKLTMAEGASITVYGAISVSAKHYAYSQKNGSGTPVGKYGYIYMNEGSSITVNGGGALYVWGFISGGGTVTAKSGATVYENMQIADFRGGSATMGMYNNGQKIFPLNQYFIQNIEVALTLESGADEYIYTSIYAASTSTSTAIHFIGGGGMFSVEGGGSFTKVYHPESDRLEMTINGDAKINNLTLSLSGMEVSSANYTLPINNSITINVASGTTQITQDVALLAGSVINIAEGATVQVTEGNSLYVYDQDEWTKANYASNAKFKRARYSPTRTYTRTNNDLVDVKIDVNGTLLSDGAVYTTAGGADIISSQGTGKVTFTSGAGTEENTYMYKDYTTDYDTIPITSAKLHNDKQYAGTAEEYTATDGVPANTTYAYCTDCGKWYTGEHYKVTFYVDGEAPKTVCSAGEAVTYDSLKSAPLKVTDGGGNVLSQDADYTYAEAEGTLTILAVQGNMDVYVYTIPVALIVTGGSTEASVAYASLADALMAYKAGEQKNTYIQMQKSETIAEALTIEKDVYLDLNGHTVTLGGGLTITEGHTLYGMDHATSNYTDETFGKIKGNVIGDVAKAHESYCTADASRVRYVADTRMKDELSFHRYNMSVTRYQFHFRPEGDCDMVFGATFRGSQTVARLLTDMGFRVAKVGTEEEHKGWWTTDNITEDAPLPPEDVLADPNGYIIQGTLINIGAGGDSSEFTANYSITALLKFDAETQMESVARVLNYLEALKSYHNSDEAKDEEKEIINTFITKHGLTKEWEASGEVDNAHPGDPEQAG